MDGRSDGVVITVKDDGVGGEIGQTGGHGIVGMRERVELLGGSFSAGGSADGCLEVRAVLPLESGTQ